jgi:hypothetical protein
LWCFWEFAILIATFAIMKIAAFNKDVIMGELSSKFSREDIEVLLEATSDWEALGSQEWHLMNMVKSAPMPPDDHEAYEMVSAIKEHFAKREKDIKESRVTRQERAVFLKAKLMLVRRDMAVNQLFEMAVEDTPQDVAAPVHVPVKCENSEAVSIPVRSGDAAAALEKAEFFIKDLGVWDHYQKFLKEKENE